MIFPEDKYNEIISIKGVKDWVDGLLNYLKTTTLEDRLKQNQKVRDGLLGSLNRAIDRDEGILKLIENIDPITEEQMGIDRNQLTKHLTEHQILKKKSITNTRASKEKNENYMLFFIYRELTRANIKTDEQIAFICSIYLKSGECGDDVDALSDDFKSSLWDKVRKRRDRIRNQETPDY